MPRNDMLASIMLLSFLTISLIAFVLLVCCFAVGEYTICLLSISLWSIPFITCDDDDRNGI